jgi:hypothetical protein
MKKAGGDVAAGRATSLTTMQHLGKMQTAAEIGNRADAMDAMRNSRLFRTTKSHRL